MTSVAQRFVAYYRVSTAKQGASGLGLAAQQSAVRAHLSHEAEIIAEFTEVESGRKNERPSLKAALSACRIHRVPLVVAKVDRLTRSVGFLSQLLESGVEVRFADLPALEGPTGRFMLQQMAAVAELEAGLISARTRAALKAAKQRGTTLGGYRGKPPSNATRQASAATRREASETRARDILPILHELQGQGITTYTGMAAALTKRSIPTPRGRTVWTGSQVERVITQTNRMESK